jgi:hypothetical protein
MTEPETVLGQPIVTTDPAAEAQKRKEGELATKWLKAIEQRRNREKNWRKQGDKVVDRYRDARTDLDKQLAKFSILWANTEVLKPAIFNRMPVPDVRRRYLTRDPVARTAAMILERALSYSMDSYDFKDVLDRVEEDYLLPGRGQAVVCYKPYFKQTRKDVEPLPEQDNDKETASDAALEGNLSAGLSDVRSEGVGTNPGGNPTSQPVSAGTPSYPPGTQFDAQGAYSIEESKLYEEVYCEYQEWKYYVFGEGKQRSKVPWEAYGDLLSKDEVREEYPDFEDYDELRYEEVDTPGNDAPEKGPGRALIWKIWHKASRKVIVVAEGYKDGPLQVMDDPLSLENFYPTPEPIQSIRTNGNDTPKPEYLMYEDQAIELDIITGRLKALTSALKYRGVFDKEMEETAKFKDLTNSPDNTFIPIPNFREMAEKGGLAALIATMPLEEIAAVIDKLTIRSNQLKQEIYEVYGISDIVRGATHPNETLGAQQMKAQYAGMRISTRQERFQRFIRDVLRLKAEIIAEHFSPETLQLMTGIDVVPDMTFQQMQQQQQVPANTVAQSEFLQACQLIKSDKLRGFRIDIETDSTIPVDRANEQQNRIQFIQAVGQYLTGILPAVQSGAIPVKLAREGLLFVVRGFKVGTELEETLEELGENQDEATQLMQLKQVNQQMQQQLQETQKQLQDAQQNNAGDQARAQADIAVSNAQAQNTIAADNAKTQNAIAVSTAKAVHGIAMKTHAAVTKPPTIPPAPPGMQ